MIRIGIIGDIGYGKSFVAKQFGLPIFNADKEVKKIYTKNKKCYRKFKNLFPNHISSFQINKKELAKIILKKKNNIKKINKIVHPEVRINLKKFLKKNRKRKAVILDIPLLIENNLNKKNDILIFVQTNKKNINKRIKKRLNLKVLKILEKFQLPMKIKKKKADFIIQNNFKIKKLKKNVKVLKNKILNYERNSSRY